ncbi:lipopolysaccharide biosynthesis protein [Porticoccus sp. GXU_MW_L64]
MRIAKNSLNQTAIYSVATIFQHATSIIMLPIYTRYLTPEDYGIADLLSMSVEMVGLVVGVVGSEAVFRFYSECKEESDKRKVIFTIFLTALFVNLLGYSFIVFTRDYSATYLFENVDVSDGAVLILLYGATMVFQTMSAIPMAYIRAQQKPTLFVLLSILRLVLAVICNLYFVVYKELHITGVVYAVFSFTFVHSLILALYLLFKTKIKFSFEISKKSMSFSWPLMFSSIALFLTTYGDRLFIKHYISISEVGLYSLAYKFGFILVSFAWTPFAQMWDSKRYEIVQKPDAVEKFRSVFRMTQAFVIFCALGLSIFSQDILRVMADPLFHKAYLITGIIVFAYVFHIWSYFCMFGILYSKKTIWKARIDWIAFPATILLYYFLVPDYGAMGAAWATIISMGLRFFALNWISTKLYNMKLQWGRIGSSVTVALILYIFSLYIQLPVVYSIILNVFLMFVFVAYLWFGFYLTREDRSQMQRLLNKGIQHFRLNTR